MIDLQFNAAEVLEKRLASSLGLDRYAEIMKKAKTTNTSEDREFQRLFNAFYRVRRNEAWRKIYYSMFEEMKQGSPTFESILRILYEKTGNIEASFSSKMLATLCPEKPIWDRYVLENLGLKLDGSSKEQQLHNAVLLYKEIENWYLSFLTTDNAMACLETFDNTFHGYTWISDIKKIDCFLWSIR